MVNFTTSALQSALNGLNISQQLLDMTSQNIANAQTTGYTAKTLQVQTEAAQGQVVGEVTGNITRNVNTALQQSVWTQTANSSQSSTISSALTNLQSLYGTTGSGTDFSTYLTTLKGDFTQLSSNPSSTAQQDQTVSDAQVFATSLNTMGQAITTARNTAESSIASAVGTINTQLQQIAQLNVQIAQTSAQGQSVADLQDQRDNAITSLSSEMNISTYTQSNGMVVVQTSSGQVLADSQAHSLVFTPQSIGSQSSYPTTLSGVYIDSTSGPDLAANASATGGTLGGLLQLRDQVLPEQQAQLDEVAEQTANRFSAQGLKLFTNSDGTIPANTPSTYTGFASTITVNPAVLAAPDLVQQGTSGTPIQSGDNTVINNVTAYTFGLDQNSSGLANTPFNTTGVGANSNLTLSGVTPTSTLETFAQNVVSDQANQSSTYTAQASYNSNYVTSLTTNLQNSDSVNLDSEVAKLTVFENSYSCSAQVVQTEQKLMADLLSVVGGTSS